MSYITNGYLTGLILLLIIYSLFCFVGLLCYFFITSIRFDQLLLSKPGTFITPSSLLTLLKLYIFYLVCILLFFRGVTGVFCFGSILVTALSYKLFFLFIGIMYVTAYLTFFNRVIKIKHLLLLNVIILLLFLFLSCLWCINSYFALIILLDVLNLLIFWLLILDLNPETVVELERTTLSNLMGLSIFFWTSFIATIFLFFGGFVLLQTFMAVDFNLLFMYFEICHYTPVIDVTIYKVYFFIFILCLLLKAGVGPFFFWKRYAFSILHTSSLFIYLFQYFTILFIYIIYFIITFTNLSILGTLVVFSIFFTLTILWVMSLLEFGTRLGDFFIFSTVFNTAFLLGLVCIILYL